MRNSLMLKALFVSACFFGFNTALFAEAVFNSPAPSVQTATDFFGQSRPLYSAAEYNAQLQQESKQAIKNNFAAIDQKAEQTHAQLVQAFQQDSQQKDNTPSHQTISLGSAQKPTVSVQVAPRPVVAAPAPQMYQTRASHVSNAGSATNFAGNASSTGGDSGSGLGIQY